MRVFVAGATGAVGRPLVHQLLKAGHEVTGMTRSEQKARALEAQGAGAAVCDAFDREGVIAAVGAARPEVVVHQLTDLPSSLNLRRLDEVRRRLAAYAVVARVGLSQAARTAGARRMVAQSIAFLYAPEGGPVKSETEPVYRDAPAPLDKSIGTVLDVERAVVGAEGLEGVVLRYGFFYGPGTYYAADGDVGGQVRARRYPVVGAGTGVTSFVHTEDAAAATLAALDRGAPGIYNIVDDEPAPIREWLPVYARALGAKPPRRVPRFVARLAAGQFAAMMSTELRGASNAKARRELGWEPRYPSWREGFAAELGGGG